MHSVPSVSDDDSRIHFTSAIGTKTKTGWPPTGRRTMTGSCWSWPTAWGGIPAVLSRPQKIIETAELCWNELTPDQDAEEFLTALVQKCHAAVNQARDDTGQGSPFHDRRTSGPSERAGLDPCGRFPRHAVLEKRNGQAHRRSFHSRAQRDDGQYLRGRAEQASQPDATVRARGRGELARHGYPALGPRAGQSIRRLQ